MNTVRIHSSLCIIVLARFLVQHKVPSKSHLESAGLTSNVMHYFWNASAPLFGQTINAQSRSLAVKKMQITIVLVLFCHFCSAVKRIARSKDPLLSAVFGGPCPKRGHSGGSIVLGLAWDRALSNFNLFLWIVSIFLDTLRSARILTLTFY